MRRISTLLTVIALSAINAFTAYSQKFDVKWGNVNTDPHIGTSIVVLGRNENEIYVERSDLGMFHTTRYFIEKFDNDFNRVFSTQIEVKSADGKKLDDNTPYFFGSRPIILSTRFDKNTDIYSIYITTVSEDGKLGASSFAGKIKS